MRLFLIIDINKRLGCTKIGIYVIIQNQFFGWFDLEGLLHRNWQPPYLPKIDHVYLSNYRINKDIYIEDNNIVIPKEKNSFL